MPDFEQVKDKLRGDTGRLAATYLAIIMGLTLVFSGVIYAISSSQFDRPLPPRAMNNTYSQFDDFTRGNLQDLFEERAQQARAELLLSLIFLNLAVLLGGAAFSYFLARKTLEPIEAAMQAQAQFVSDASHELRTPLTALQVTNEVALRKKKLTIAQAKDLIAHNLAETIKLRDLTEALLGLARQDSGAIRRTDVQVESVVDEAVRTIQPLANEKHIAISSKAAGVTAIGDQAALTQIVTILLDNAVKYSPEGSTVTVDGVQNGTAATTISVKDEGSGIDAKHHAKIFDRFYRVDESRSSQNVQGNGLGLAIASAIAKRHGYVLTVESAVGSGSVFNLHIQN